MLLSVRFDQNSVFRDSIFELIFRFVHSQLAISYDFLSMHRKKIHLLQQAHDKAMLQNYFTNSALQCEQLNARILVFRFNHQKLKVQQCNLPIKFALSLLTHNHLCWLFNPPKLLHWLIYLLKVNRIFLSTLLWPRLPHHLNVQKYILRYLKEL